MYNKAWRETALCPRCNAPLVPNGDGTITCYRCISEIFCKYLKEKNLIQDYQEWRKKNREPTQNKKIHQELTGQQPKKKYNQTIAIDFDNTISCIPNFAGEKVLGPPIKGAREAIKKLKKNGKKIIIFTTRAEWEIKKWLEDHDIPYDEINKNSDIQGTNPGKPIANVMIDDRCITFNGKWDDQLVSKILNYKPYYRK